MSSKDCLVLVFPKGQEPYVVQDPKGGMFSKKESQRVASAHLRDLGENAVKAEIMQHFMTVNPGD